MSVYCSRSDVYGWLPRGVVQRPARLAASVSTALDTLTLDDHGLADDDEITFRAESGGSLPSPLAAGTTYYASATTASTFKVAASAGGAAINLTTAGSNVLVIATLPWDRWIEDESATLDCTVPAHVVPFATVPHIVRKYVSAMVAKRAAVACGVATPLLDGELAIIREDLKLWRTGIAIRGQAEPTQAQVPQLYVSGTTQSTRSIE